MATVPIHHSNLGLPLVLHLPVRFSQKPSWAPGSNPLFASNSTSQETNEGLAGWLALSSMVVVRVLSVVGGTSPAQPSPCPNPRKGRGRKDRRKISFSVYGGGDKGQGDKPEWDWVLREHEWWVRGRQELWVRCTLYLYQSAVCLSDYSRGKVIIDLIDQPLAFIPKKGTATRKTKREKDTDHIDVYTIALHLLIVFLLCLAAWMFSQWSLALKQDSGRVMAKSSSPFSYKHPCFWVWSTGDWSLMKMFAPGTPTRSILPRSIHIEASCVMWNI